MSHGNVKQKVTWSFDNRTKNLIVEQHKIEIDGNRYICVSVMSFNGL